MCSNGANNRAFALGACAYCCALLLKFSDSGWSCICNSQGDIVNAVIDAIEFAYQFLKSGKLHCDKDLALTGWGINYNNVTGQANQTPIVLWHGTKEGPKGKAQGGVYFDNTYVNIEAGLTFELDVDDYWPTHVKAAVYGKAKANAEARADVSAEFEDHNSTLVHTFVIPKKYCPTIRISGIPFEWSVSIPLEVGYDFKASGSAQVSAKAHAQGFVKFGMKAGCPAKTTDSCDFNQYSDYDWDHEPQRPKLSLDVDASLKIWLLPTVQLNIDHIGAPSMGLKTSLELKVSGGGNFAGSNNYCAKKPNNMYGAQIAANLGFEITAGLQVDIGFKGPIAPEHKCSLGPFPVPCPRIVLPPYGPWGIWSKKLPIWSGCVGFGSQAISSTPLAVGDQGASNAYEEPSFETDGLVPGTTWTGIQRRTNTAGSCKGFPTLINISLQLVNRTLKQSNGQGRVRDFSAEFVATQTWANEEGDDHPFGCLVQTGYDMAYLDEGVVLMTPSSNFVQSSVNYQQCTEDRTENLRKPDSFRATKFFSCTTDNGTHNKVCSLTLEDEEKCSEVVLTVSDISEGPFPLEHREKNDLQLLYEEWRAHIVIGMIVVASCCLCCCCMCWRERKMLKTKSRPIKRCCTVIEGCLGCRHCKCPCRRHAEYNDPFLL